MRKWFNSKTAAFVIFSLFAFLFAPWFANASFAASAPPSTLSHYVTYTDTNTFYNMGCSLGTKDKNAGLTYDNIVVLDFGQPLVSGGVQGMSTFGNGFISMAGVTSAVENYAKGFYTCTGSNPSTVRIVAGTSNYGSYVTSAHGAALAVAVNNANSWLSSQGYSNWISAAGGCDMETSWNSASTTKAWANGYNGSHQYGLYNYGDAGGCPKSQGGTCNNGWTQGDVYYVTWGVPAGFALPEIYNTTGTNATQWQQISLWGYLNDSQGKITFSGAMTQYNACAGTCSGTDNTPSAGWTQLYNAVNSDSRTASSVRWSTDISWGTGA
ncbi:hypothetical protein [Tumebacillus flagellatus]|uniref:Uncharacterized protein n=1 Tax=Tumebacillus flagellatus TaxID=1157490 RepID=A0A074LSV1_9BACL|nr:hypothetical protein [Tumebacillus flagellatus]KEO82903.1 hypothetical protein EL26_12460 [Tumebacillus flagellatus]